MAQTVIHGNEYPPPAILPGDMPTGTETAQGALELATDAETIAGASSALATHPHGVSAAIADRIADTKEVNTVNPTGATETLLEGYNEMTMDQSCTFTMPTVTTEGALCVVRLVENGTGGWSPTFTGVRWPSGVIPPIATGANSISLWQFVTFNTGTNWYGSLVGDSYA